MLLQAALEKEKNVSEVEESGKQEFVEALTSQVNELAVQDSQAQDIDKRIRALRKKVRRLCFDDSYLFPIATILQQYYAFRARY